MTNHYYTEHAQDFFDSTVGVDVQKLYEHFLPTIKQKGNILDAGCGSGRDSKHFLELGFKVSAFDANEALVSLASSHLGQPVTLARFDTFAGEPNSFDGIWACASLLHVEAESLPSAFIHLGKLLKANGVFYCSFKYGESALVRNGRYFTDMNEKKLEDVLSQTGLVIDKTWKTSDARPGRESEKWLNAILIKA
ncbi:class I SAM-dependent DNA methyltransferase [Vibrio sp. DNB22_10_4]